MVTQERLKELFEYKDGDLYRKKDGKLARVKSNPKQRYERMTIDSKVYRIHRMIFLYHNGYLPDVLDHIDGNKKNNIIENLRVATQQQNCLNRMAHKNNRSGYKNVHWANSMNKWCVLINVDGKRKVINYFEDVELAGLVAQEARDLYHGEFANHH